ncbi:MAG: thaumatin family protein [Pseudomonadota bacterium]
MRFWAAFALLTCLQAAACGGVARPDAGGTAGGGCSEPALATPDAGVFQAPAVGALGSYQVTFRNQCAQAVWPAWSSTGGLDNSIVDSAVWLPMPPGVERTVTVYGGVREVAFWGRTGCSFDATGRGGCETGECGAFMCNGAPQNTTVFDLELGFQGGYNLGLRVDGASCGVHECVANVRACSAESAIMNACGEAIACETVCDGPTSSCCPQPGSGCTGAHAENGAPDVGDLKITFCP